MTDTSPLARVEHTCATLTKTGQPVTFTVVAASARVGRATLYRDPQLRASIEEHRARQADGRTLSGLSAEIAHLRTALETLAGTVKRHEERLRQLERRHHRKIS